MLMVQDVLKLINDFTLSTVPNYELGFVLERKNRKRISIHDKSNKFHEECLYNYESQVFPWSKMIMEKDMFNPL